MKIVLDPYLHRHLPLNDLCRKAAELGVDGIVTACIFGWEERADASGRFMRERIGHYVDKHFKGQNQ